jgi:putative transposase
MPEALPPRRKLIRLRDYDYAAAAPYFVTICTMDRACALGSIHGGVLEPSPIGEIVADAWDRLPDRFPRIDLDAFVVMPNHVHGIVGIHESGGFALTDVVRVFKSISAHHARRHRVGADRPLWQRSFYDHVIRNDVDLDRVRQYILENPAKWETDTENPQRRTPDARQA